MDVVIETARVFGNFSQEPQIRQLLRRTRADEVLVAYLLLDDSNREVVFTVCGVLMNLMGDPDCREMMRTIDGVRALIEVLADAGTSDWQLAGMICKTLWNL